MATPNSSSTSVGADILASQMKDLRDDVLDPVTGHNHDGTTDGGKNIPTTSINPQGAGSGLDVDTLDGLEAAGFCQVRTGLHKDLPAAGVPGCIYLPTDLPSVVMMDDGAVWNYIGADPMRVAVLSVSALQLDPRALQQVTANGGLVDYEGLASMILRGWRLRSIGGLNDDEGYAALRFNLGATATNTGVARVPVIMRGLVNQKSSFSTKRVIRFGLADEETTTKATEISGPNNGIYFEVPHFAAGDSGANDFWRAVTRSSDTSTTTDTTLSAASVFRKLEIIWDSSTQVRFFIDDVLVATHTTNIPSADMFWECAVMGPADSESEAVTNECLLGGLMYIQTRA